MTHYFKIFLYAETQKKERLFSVNPSIPCSPLIRLFLLKITPVVYWLSPKGIDTTEDFKNIL